MGAHPLRGPAIHAAGACITHCECAFRGDGLSCATRNRMEPAGDFTIHIEQRQGFEFGVRFDNPEHAPIRMDEPAPLGRDSAPNPSRMLAAAIGDCLAASFVFCLKRRGVTVEGLTSTVRVELVRNEKKRLRIGRIDVAIHPKGEIPEGVLDECLGVFEDFCVVTQSVREGLPVHVTVARPGGTARRLDV